MPRKDQRRYCFICRKEKPQETAYSCEECGRLLANLHRLHGSMLIAPRAPDAEVRIAVYAERAARQEPLFPYYRQGG